MNKKRKLESDEGMPIVVSSGVTVKEEDIETDNEEDNTSFRPKNTMIGNHRKGKLISRIAWRSGIIMLRT